MLVEVDPAVSLDVCDIGSGRPVVLLAGFGFDHEVWDRQLRVLAAEHRAIGISLRGTGTSSKPTAGYELPRLAGDVQAVLEALDLRDVALVGWSLGGLVAFRLAATAAERLSQLILVGSNGVGVAASEAFPFGPPAAALEQALVGGELGDRVVARRRAVARGFREEPDSELLDWLMGIQLRMPSWAAVATFRTYANADQLDLVDDVRLPVLQLIGAHDQAAPMAGARWLADRLADSRLVQLAGCAHTPMLEAPDQFDAELLAFLAR